MHDTALYAILSPVRPSVSLVCLSVSDSVCPSVTRMDHGSVNKLNKMPCRPVLLLSQGGPRDVAAFDTYRILQSRERSKVWIFTGWAKRMGPQWPLCYIAYNFRNTDPLTSLPQDWGLHRTQNFNRYYLSLLRHGKATKYLTKTIIKRVHPNKSP